VKTNLKTQVSKTETWGTPSTKKENPEKKENPRPGFKTRNLGHALTKKENLEKRENPRPRFQNPKPGAPYSRPVVRD